MSLEFFEEMHDWYRLFGITFFFTPGQQILTSCNSRQFEILNCINLLLLLEEAFSRLSFDILWADGVNIFIKKSTLKKQCQCCPTVYFCLSIGWPWWSTTPSAIWPETIWDTSTCVTLPSGIVSGQMTVAEECHGLANMASVWQYPQNCCRIGLYSTFSPPAPPPQPWI